jgi:hypothetical protein
MGRNREEVFIAPSSSVHYCLLTEQSAPPTALPSRALHLTSWGHAHRGSATAWRRPGRSFAACKANKRLSYDIVLDAQLEGTHITSTNTINLHNQMYHYLHNYASTAEGAAAAQDGSHSQYAAAS